MSESMAQLEWELARLPEPEPPAGLAGAVMAGVARVDLDHGVMVRVVAGEERRGAATAGGGTAVRGRGRGRLAAAVGASGLATYVYGLVRGDWTFNPVASPVGDGLTALAAFAQSGPAVLGLAMALLLYVVGLLGPLGGDSLADLPARPQGPPELG